MITREQIEEIQTESREKGVSIKKLLEEKGIPAHQYFWWKRKYSKQEVAAGFLPVAGTMPPAVMSMASGAAGGPRTYRLYTSIFHKKLPIFGNFSYLCKKIG